MDTDGALQPTLSGHPDRYSGVYPGGDDRAEPSSRHEVHPYSNLLLQPMVLVNTPEGGDGRDGREGVDGARVVWAVLVPDGDQVGQGQGVPVDPDGLPQLSVVN